MKPLTIELAKGEPRQLQSIGWKTSQGDDCRRHFYALDQAGKPLVVTPKPALPEYYDPCKQAPAVFKCDPFPEAVCVEISPCRLLPPPCYQSREDFEGPLPAHPVEPAAQIIVRQFLGRSFVGNAMRGFMRWHPELWC